MIIEQLRRQFENMPDLRAREIRVDKQLRKVFCTLSYPNLTDVDAQMRNEIALYIKKLVPQGYSCSVSFVNDSFTEASFRKLLSEFFKKKFPVFASLGANAEVKLEGKNIKAIFRVNHITEKNAEAALLTDKLSAFFADYTSYCVSFFLSADDSDLPKADLSEQEKLVRLAINRELLKPSRCFAVSNVIKHIGKIIQSSPMYIADIRKPSESYVVCGTVSGKTLKSSKNNPNMYVCKFTLSDASGGSIPCVIFTRFDISDYKTIKETMGKTDSEALTISRTRALANDKKMKKMMDIYDGMSVIVRGKVAYNSFSEQLEMCVYDLCKCNIAPIGNAAHYNKAIPDEYSTVKPEVYSEYVQASFVSNERRSRSPLNGKSYVVLHANATGYNVVKDKIVAICAVKIEDGRISEKIFSYVNPESDVDAYVLDKAKTTVDRLVFYPTITELIPDLFKFVYGSVLVGLDAPKIIDILNYYASPLGYRFTNETEHQGDVFSLLFDLCGHTRKPNCSRIEDVAKHCRVTCLGSVFCHESAVTTARCMVALSNRSK